MTREKSMRSRGKDITFGDYLEDRRRKCHKKHSYESGKSGKALEARTKAWRPCRVPDSEGSASGPGSRKNLRERLWGSASLAREWTVRSGHRGNRPPVFVTWKREGEWEPTRREA